jgi:aminoglycoside 6'-N-acetyltransferase I
MELFFRQIVDKDIEEIVDLMVDTYSNEPWNEKWDRETAVNKIDSFIKNNSARNFCVTNEKDKIIGVLLGFTKYFIDSKEFYIDEYFIGNNYHRKGIGKIFMEYVENILEQKGYASIVLLTTKSFPSEHFYSNIGFKTSQDTIFMYKDIR